MDDALLASAPTLVEELCDVSVDLRLCLNQYSGISWHRGMRFPADANRAGFVAETAACATICRMALSTVQIHLIPSMFGERERVLVATDELTAHTFRFDSGVCGLRLRNARGELVMLPFQGQQIWSARMNGRDLTMRSMFTQPRAGVPFLETFGGFLQHCGATAMGGPSPEDTHPLHGELPNAPFQEAQLSVGADETGAYIALGGRYQHTVAFATNYAAEPHVKLRANASVFEIGMRVTNLKASPMDLLYLMHVNFRPVDQGRLCYSARYTPEHVRVRTGIPAHIKPLPGYPEFLQVLKANPEKHHRLDPALMFDPEVALFIDYQADGEGWARSVQVHPNGEADYVAHRPDQLPKATRWLCRTADQDSIAIVEPGTAEPEGYLAEKRKGNIMVLPPRGVWQCQVLAGALNAAEAAAMEARVDAAMGRS